MFHKLQLAVLLLLVVISSSATAQLIDESTLPKDIRSPRQTMRTFLRASNEFLENGDDDSFQRAAQCLDWPTGESHSDDEKKELIRRLKGIIDRMILVDVRKISDESNAETYLFPPGGDEQPIEIGRSIDGAWRFTSETVGKIDSLWEAWKDKPLIVKSVPWYRSFEIAGNAVWRIVALFAALLIAWIVGRVLRFLLKSSASSLDKRGRQFSAVGMQALARAVVLVALVIGLNVGLHFLVMIPAVESAASTIVAILFTLAIAYAVWCLVDVVNAWLLALAAKTTSKLDDMLAPMIRTTLRVTVIILTLVQVATVLSDKPMTSIIAGLSVGGLAVGLAAQDLIKNFFGSIMIFSDRPFELGDRIQVDGFDGSVEAVGFRSTRVRTLDGHLVTMPNGELANKSIRNVAKRPNIRRILNVGVTYDTSPEKVQEAIDILKDVLKDHEGQAEDMPARVYFNEFQDSSLNLFAIYWYHPADWWAYCAFSQWVNMEVYKRFNEAGIEFAFPSQTIYLAGGGEQQALPTAG
jgi:MscS family membrane protein